MRNLIFLMFLCFTAGHAQKQTEEELHVDVDQINFSSDEVFRIRVRAAPVEKITLISRSEGEYYNDISLDWEIRDNILFLRSQFREILRSGFDKLSAHKVFSMEVELVIPQGMKLEINSNLASVHLLGKFEEVLVQLKSGSCFLKSFDGNAVINTYQGNIDVGTELSEAQVEADSRHGTVDIPPLTAGKNHFKLNSINGNISVHKTK